jgi:hypothetical protein
VELLRRREALGLPLFVAGDVVLSGKGQVWGERRKERKPWKKVRGRKKPVP